MDTTCPCCGERYERARDEIGVVCACEWDGCDASCPHVGHLFDTPDTPDVDEEWCVDCHALHRNPCLPAG